MEAIITNKTVNQNAGPSKNNQYTYVVNLGGYGKWVHPRASDSFA